MMKELRDMIHENSWQQLPAFAPYMKSIEGLPRLGDKTKPGREMMDAIAEAFFDQYLASAIKHLEKQWTSDMLLPYLIGDDKEFRHEFLLLLQACEDGRLPDMKEHLKTDELARMGREDNVKEGKKVESINSFKPQSQEMIEKIPVFLEWKQSKLSK